MLKVMKADMVVELEVRLSHPDSGSVYMGYAVVSNLGDDFTWDDVAREVITELQQTHSYYHDVKITYNLVIGKEIISHTIYDGSLNYPEFSDEESEDEDDYEPYDIDSDCGYDPYMGCFSDEC